MFKKLMMAVIAAFAVIAVYSPVTSEARSLDEILSSKKLIVGVNPTLPPLGKFNEKNEIVGFDVDLSQKLADMLGVELEVVKVGSPDRIPFVASGKIDYVMGAMTRNPKRAMIIDFTVPAHTEVFGVLTTEGKPYKSYKDLNDAGVKLVQVRGTTPLKFIKENVSKAEVLLLDNYPCVLPAPNEQIVRGA